VGFSTKRCLLVAPVSSASLFLPRLLPAKIAAVALSAVAMRADAEDGFTRIAASWTKQDLGMSSMISLRCASAMMLRVHSQTGV
jgi:hypothetical protein